MNKITFRDPSASIGIILIAMMFVFSGCQYKRGPAPRERRFPSGISKMVVMGFRPGMSQEKTPGVIRNPLTGAVSMAEPVPVQSVDLMTQKLFDRLLKNKAFRLVSPAQAMGVFSSLVSSDLVSDDIEIYRKIGKSFSADAVLIGYLYRWREREGKDYAASRPASVAFDLYLIRPSNGSILWKGIYDKTQKSLTENLLDVDTFIKGGGKWMEAEKLAEIGLEKLLGELPYDKE